MREFATRPLLLSSSAHHLNPCWAAVEVPCQHLASLATERILQVKLTPGVGAENKITYNDILHDIMQSRSTAFLRGRLSIHSIAGGTTALEEWNALHTILAWGCGRHCVSHSALVEYKRPCSCYFPPERGLLRMTHRYIKLIRVETSPGCL